MKALFRFLIIILFSLSSGWCAAESESPTHNECASLFKQFFWLPIREQLTQFAHFDLDRQYVVYICGNQEIHPPTMYLVEPFAKQGKIAVPLLTKKLMETRNDLSARDIIYVFNEMQSRKTYDVAGDKVLLPLIEKRASEIQDKFWRDYTKKLIAEISKRSE